MVTEAQQRAFVAAAGREGVRHLVELSQFAAGAGFPPWQADGIIEDHAHYRRGEASAVATG